MSREEDGGCTRDFVAMVGAVGTRVVVTAGGKSIHAEAKVSNGSGHAVAMAINGCSRIGEMASVGGGRVAVMVSVKNQHVVMVLIDQARPAREGKVPRAPPGAELQGIGRLLDWQRRSRRQA